MADTRNSDIVVTGQRGKELTTNTGKVGVLGDVDILDAPFSVQSYSEALIKDTQAITVSDILQRDASYTVTSTSNRAAPWDDFAVIRGFDIANNNSVSTDGLFGLAGLTPAIESVSRVDLLKGPSAFLTGAPASVGGTISFAPKRATAEGINNVGISYLSDSIFGVDGDVGRRFAGGRIGVRVSGAFREGDTVFNDGHLRRGNVALGADADLGTVRLSLDARHETNRSTGYSYYLSFGPTYPIETGLPPAMDARDGTQPNWFTYYSRINAVQGRAEWDFAPGWTASAAYGVAERRSGYDGYCYNQLRDRGGTTDCYVGSSNGRSPSSSGDLRVTGRFRTGPITHQIVIGANRIFQKDEYGSSGFAPTYVFNIYDDIRPPKVTLPPDGQEFLYGRRVFKSLVVGDTLGIADDLVTLTIGARRADIVSASYGYLTGVLQSRAAGARWTPAVAATFQPSDALTFYGNYIEALEPGAQAPVTAINAGEVFPPFVSDQIEFGVKGRLGGLTASAAWFSIRRQTGFLSSRTNPPTFVSDGLQENKGVELAVNGNLTRRVRIVTSASWISARFKETADGLLDGNRVPTVPKWAARGLVEWDVAALPGLTLIGGVNHTGPTPFDSANTFDVPGWTKGEVGARYGFTVKGTELIARLSIDNVTRERFWIAGYDGGFAPVAPRTVALSLGASF